jgi:hypothetical protein
MAQHPRRQSSSYSPLWEPEISPHIFLYFVQSAIPVWWMLKVVRWRMFLGHFCHYPLSSATTNGIIAHVITWEWLKRNLVWMLCHWRLLRTSTIPTIGNTNVVDAQSHVVGGSSSAMMPLPMILSSDQWHCLWCIYQWSYKLFILQSMSGLATNHNVLYRYVTILMPEESLFCWRKWLIELSN